MIVTRLAWIAHKLVSANRQTKYASDASCSARTAWLWKRKSGCNNKITIMSINLHKRIGARGSKYKLGYLEVLSNLTYKPLERKFPDQQICTLLILTDFTTPKYGYTKYNETYVLTDNFIVRQNRKMYRRATVPGRYLCGFLPGPVLGADI